MPLIRYEIGDFASPSDQACPCGRGLSILSGVEGRSSEMFRTRDGRMVSGLWFTGVFREIPAVKRFQVRQTDYDAFHVRYTTDSSVAPDILLADMFAKVRDQFGAASRITVVREDEIAPEGSGKFRFLISDVR
jgi:phenylacetate-CoA ligase